MRHKLLVITYVFILLISPTLNAYSIDPVPLLKLLKDVLDSVAVGDYVLSKDLISTALAVDLVEVNYVHRSAYLRLNRLVELLITSKSLGDSVNTTYLRSLIYDLYRTSYDLNISINSYLDMLTKYFRDPRLRDRYLGDVSTSLSSTYDVVSDVLSRLVMRYLGGTSYLINVSVSTPNVIYGGSEYLVSIYVSMPNDVKYVDMFMYVNYGGLYTYLSTSIPTNENYSLTLKTPPTEEFLVRGYQLSPEVGYEVLVRVYSSFNNYTYLGQGTSKGVLKFLRPNLIITPKVVNDELVSLMINTSLNNPLNTSVFVDDELITTLEVFSGVYEVPLNIRLGLGKLLVKVVTEARGPYLGSLWTYQITPTSPTPDVGVDVDTLVVGPPFNTLLTLYVSTTPYILKLSACGVLISEYVNTSTKSLSISIPWNTVFWCDLGITVEYLTTNQVVSRSVRIYVVNIPITTSLTVCTVVVVMMPTTRRYLRGLRLFIPKLITQYRGSYEVTTKYVGIRFRESKLSKLYRSFLGIMAKYVGPPKHSETLREYLVRVKEVVRRPIHDLVSLFILNYELDLYSKHTPNLEYVRNVLRRLKDVLK